MLTTALTTAHGLLRQGESQAVIDRCTALLREHPEHATVLHLMGLAYLQQDRLQEAEHCLQRALRAAPSSPQVLNELGIVRMKQGAQQEATDFFSAALELDPVHRDALSNIAAAYTAQKQSQSAASYLDRLTQVLPFSAQAHARAADNSLELDDTERAVRHGHAAVKLDAESAEARLSLAAALEAAGRFKQARFQYLSVLVREPGHVSALSKLLSLQGAGSNEQHAWHAEELLQQPVSEENDHVQLRLGLARYWDRRGEYDRAFDHLQAANAVMFRNHPFDSALQASVVDRCISVFTPQLFQTLPRPAVPGSKPIFIVGMPRSGTTLLEQILASHSRVAPGGELPTLIGIAIKLGQGSKPYPEVMGDLDAQALADAANEYLGKLDSISATADRVTDKMPFNFMHVGLIRALFPAAKIIHCRRDALDTCVSCLFTTFSEPLQFASDLRVLGAYYLDYLRLMQHWQAVLPAPCFELQYEELVRDTAGTVRRLLDYCELDWEPACVEFYRTERGVRTPSRWQVRQPIYGNSIGRWRRYERQLQPLKEMLGYS